MSLLDEIVGAHARKQAGQVFVRPESAPPKKSGPTREEILNREVQAERAARVRAEARVGKLEDALRDSSARSERERGEHGETKRALARAVKKLEAKEKELLEVRGVIGAAQAEAEAVKASFSGYRNAGDVRLAASIKLVRELRDNLRGRPFEVRDAVRRALGGLGEWFRD